MAQIIIDVPDNAVTRVLTAIGHYLNFIGPTGFPRDATAAEAKAYLARHVKDIVKEQERREQVNAIVITPPDVT